MKRILASSAIGFAFFVLAISPAHAASTKLTLQAEGTDYSINEDLLKTWESANAKSTSYISFEPEQDLNALVLSELGLKNSSNQQVHLENYNVAAIYKYLKGIETEINQDPEDAMMRVEGDRVAEFNPGKKGQDLDIKTSIDQIVLALDQNKDTIQLAVNETTPLKSLAETNDLGIKDLVAFGESDFSGSPKNRIFNIKVGVEKEKGILIKQGDEFSFNKYLGPVDGEHGFLPELVIKKTGTVPEFGGGLCQVSSTVFRAAMKAGLPITERRNHSYAVQYYAPQGTDATIYPGVQDLKFINDTQGTLLVWPEIDKNKLRFYLYGIKDDRQVVLSTPVSYDRQANGAMKALWERTVTMPDGTVKNDSFKSVYQSPALFHKVTTFPENVSTNPNTPLPESLPATTTPTPTPEPTTTTDQPTQS